MKKYLQKIANIINTTDELKAIKIFALCLSIVFAIIAIATRIGPATGAMDLFFGFYFVVNFLKWFKKRNKGAYTYLGIATASIVLGFVKILGG